MAVDFGLYSSPVVYDKFDLAMQELDILFSTENTELIGDSEYGMNFLQFLWELTPAEESIEKYIKEKINTSTYYLNKIKYEIWVECIQGVNENIYVVHISLYKNNEIYKEKTYTIIK